MSRSRLALLLLLGAGTAQASTWTDLWATRDQQGQRLLDHEQPAAAAQVFDDARRRGYAELEAGHYAAAAKLLEPYRDVDSQYNRGNALAHSGKLQQALEAYEAALAAAPGSPDVIKNRDLVKSALDQQRQGSRQQQQGSKTGSGNRHEQQQDGAKNGSSGGGNDNQEDASNGSTGNGSQGPSRSERGGQGSAKGQSSQSVGGEQNSPGSETADRRSQQGQSQTSARGRQGAMQAQNQQLDGSQPGGPALPGTGKSDGGDQHAAGSNGQTSLVQGNPGRAGQAFQNQYTTAPDRSQLQKPQSEQALALDQWLRTIPEDSGELLQRKFMIEHLLKQRGNAP